MNWKATLVLHVVVIVYVIIGGVIFNAIEGHNEVTMRANLTQEYYEFLANNPCVDPLTLGQFLTTLHNAFKSGTVVIGNYSSSHSNWDMYNSVFFSATVVTTIGYGNVSPATDGGRSFCVIFAIIGIPLMLFLLAGIGEQQNRFISFIRKLICRKLCQSRSERFQCIMGSLVTSIVGLALFFFIPAIIFSTVEGWTYNESLYYSFVTLLTVGFGDYVAGESSDRYQHIGLYRLMLAAWIIIGLAYCSGFVTSCQETYSEFFKKTRSAVGAVADNIKLGHHCDQNKLTKNAEDIRRDSEIIDLEQERNVVVDPHPSNSGRSIENNGLAKMENNVKLDGIQKHQSLT